MAPASDGGGHPEGAMMAKSKMQKVMHEFKTGTLHSGKKGPVVKSRKQAIAIAMSEQSKSTKRSSRKRGK